MTLDYGQHSAEVTGDNWAVGNVVRKIYVGGEPRSVGSTSLVLNGLKGCVEVGPDSSCSPLTQALSVE